MEILNVDQCPFSDKHGMYGGASGDKDGLVINDENWLVKYPKNAKDLARHAEMKYTNDPVSEYIGSHIYDLLGYPVHETMLVERHNKIAVACRDFETNGKRLIEVRTIKNAANPELTEKLDKTFSSTGSTHGVDFENIQLHLQYNDLLRNIEGIKERFWDMLVIDSYLNNSDRNNGNWGIIRQPGYPDELAPVYDNGGALNGKTPDSRLARMLENPDILLQNATHGNTTFLDKSGKPISVEQMFANPVADLQTAITRVVPHIKRLTPQIHQIIQDIPDRACSPIRKQFYQTTLDMRLEHILEPALHHIQAHDHVMQNQDVTIPMPAMFNHHDPIIETTRRTTQALKHDHVISLPQYFDLINTASSVEIQQGIKESLVQDLIQYSRPCAVQAVQQAAKFFQTDVNISQSRIPIQINYISTPDHQNDVLNITADSLNQPIIIHLSDLFDAAKHTMMPKLYAQFAQDTKTFITEHCGIMTFENHTELIADIQTPIQNDHVLDLSDSDDLILT